MILENSLYEGKDADISENLRNALFDFFVDRLRDLQAAGLATGVGLLSDRYFNAMRAKFGYAVTCHKAQGGEWAEIGIDFGKRDDINSPHMRKWAYTAITRAKEVAYLENAPEIHPLTKIKILETDLGLAHLEDRMKSRLIAKHGMRAATVPGEMDTFCEYDEFLCRLLTDILAPLDIMIKKPNADLQDSLRIKFVRRGNHTDIDFYRKTGTNKKTGLPNPVMFTAAHSTGTPTSDKKMTQEILTQLAKNLIRLK